ncbi:MAG: ABC transporter ATP-binding protein [Prevotella sp.]|jgi:iron complex transport system ATP-binding protein
MKSIILQHLVIGNQGKRVAGPLDAEFRPGLVSCLLGRNGVGKSTLLRTLSGFQPAMGGSVLIDSRNLLSLTRLERARIISVVLTGRPQVDNLTAAEVVALGRSPYTGFFGRLHESDRKAVDEALRDMGIASLAQRNVATLSDGEMQKVMIAKALAQQTPVILLDEPTAFLDFPSKVEVMASLSRLAAEQQKIIILSTHDVELALRTPARLYSFDTCLNETAKETVKEKVERIVSNA